MNRYLLALSLLLVLLACPGEPEEDCSADGCGDGEYCDEASGRCLTDIVFADANLEQCVREHLARPEGAIKVTDVRGLDRLECPDRGIAAIGGLQHFGALQELSLWENQIQDISSLAQVTTLTSLQLGDNQIADLGPLAGLVELRRLGISFNRVVDVGPLAGLTNLEWLNLDRNQIADAEPLRGLAQLRWLTVEHNPIGDYSPVDAHRSAEHQVYKAAPPAGPPADAMDPHALRHARADEPYGRDGLSFELLADGELRLRQRAGGVTHDLRKEYGGELRLRGDRIVYRLDGLITEVGQITPVRLELCSASYAAVCQLAIGRKWPERYGEGVAQGVDGVPIYSANLVLRSADGSLGGPSRSKAEGDALFVLDPYTLASPNQYDAGSCNFMANTGAMEILLNQHTAPEAISYGGETDLSERYLMSASDLVPYTAADNYYTDLTYVYNYIPGSLLSRDYPFAIGYVEDNAQGDTVPSTANDPDSYASCMVNWFNQLPTGWRDQLVATPLADRSLIFINPVYDDSVVHQVGLMNDDIIERIKHELRTKHAPVIVIHNFNLYWHASIIIGYDDNIRMGTCPHVMESISYFDSQGATYYSSRIRSAMAAQGGCRDHGVFYVRDSIYDGGAEEEMYSYGLGYTDRYSQRVILHTYDWAKYLGNHAYSVHRVGEP